jgi:hypothetical protein
MTHYYTFLQITGMSWLIPVSPHFTSRTQFLHSPIIISVLIHYRDETTTSPLHGSWVLFLYSHSYAQALRATSWWILQMENIIFCNVKPCRLTAASFWGRRVSPVVCLRSVLPGWRLDPEDGGCTSLSKHRKTSTGLQSITFEKTIFLTVTQHY